MNGQRSKRGSAPRFLDTIRRASMSLAGCVLLAVPIQSLAEQRPFTVLDSIRMRRIMSIDGDLRPASANRVALYSPDRRYLLVRTRRGDIARDENVDELLLWATSDVEALLSSGGKGEVAAPTLVAEYRYDDDWLAMSGVQWIGSDEIGFIGRGQNGHRQVLIVNRASREVSQASNSDTDVDSFAVSGDHLVYFARTRPTSERRLVATLGDNGIADFLSAPEGDSSGDPVRLFVTSRASGETHALTESGMLVADNRIWISPDGEYAITLSPAVNAPSHWGTYRVRDNENTGWTSNWVRSDPTSRQLYSRQRYQLVDLRSKKVRPLIDAPDGALSFGRTPRAVYWLDDGRHVIVAHTYLPLRGVDARERQRRTLGPAIAEIDVRTGEATAVVWEPFATIEDQRRGVQREAIVQTAWDAEKRVLSVVRVRADRKEVKEYYKRAAGSWVRLDRMGDRAELPQIERKESFSERPKLYAAGGGCRCSRMLFDPAPEMESFSFGREERITWADPRGNLWRGLLIYPVGFERGKRYPFVLQTHGYSDHEFVVDGPAGTTTAFAAQPLANAGFVVLQAGESGRAITGDGAEGKNVADSWKVIVDELALRGLIDPKRVGVIGWSRTGYHVAAMLAEYPDAVAAATIADAVQYSYTQQMFATGSASYTRAFERVTGGSPVSDGYAPWFGRNPIYRMNASAAAVRVEAIGLGSLMGMWETYAVRAHAERPVDFVYFPAGSHTLQKPSERLASQGGNVDWFRFWLQDYEDPDVNKKAQYERWRQLRDRRRQNASETPGS